ncbi:unnamed protein product [Cladocopium goreaui]|uniref:Uncharacterized protein n=1 Tax=Cladocopium goreaui TaxID=2562237 RepID=A0A9P1DPX6_9DINO|nr:unnamed protein product [Cladocopium goreaui]
MFERLDLGDGRTGVPMDADLAAGDPGLNANTVALHHVQSLEDGPQKTALMAVLEAATVNQQVESEAPSAPEIAPSPTESPSLTVPDTMPAAAQMELARKDTTQLEADAQRALREKWGDDPDVVFPPEGGIKFIGPKGREESDFLQPGEDWMNSSLNLSMTRSSTARAKGKHVLMPFLEVKKKFGQAIATSILQEKKGLEANKSKSDNTVYFMQHPDAPGNEWSLIRVWDAMEYEEEKTDALTMAWEASGAMDRAQTKTLLTEVLVNGFKAELEQRLGDIKKCRVELERLFALRIDDEAIDRPENSQNKDPPKPKSKAKAKGLPAPPNAVDLVLRRGVCKESSFAKTQKVLKYVDKDLLLGWTLVLSSEFKLHGVELQGPCKALQQAGCGGKFTSNVQRDILRKVAKADPKQAMMICSFFNASSSQRWCHPGPSKAKGPLLELPGFAMEMVKWDSMHIVNLGCDLWICGSVMKKLLEYDDAFGGLALDEEDRLLIAYDSFKLWARKNKVQKLVPHFVEAFFWDVWG